MNCLKSSYYRIINYFEAKTLTNMLDCCKNHSEYTLHIVLATIPQKQEKEFDESVDRDFFGKYRKEAEKYCSPNNEDYWYHNNDRNTAVLYNPLKYFILGNYDIAYISLIDNFKFAQRLFEPQDSENTNNPDLFFPHTFQSFTGITHTNTGDSLKGFFYDRLKLENPTRKYFLGVCNLKLNNGLLIGNGKKYLKAVIDAIYKVIDEYNNKLEDQAYRVESLLLQSFSWFEISLLVFTDNADSIASLMRGLRGLSVKNLDDYEEIIKDSLYKSLFNDEHQEPSLNEANVFADTHTYIGIHSELVTGKPEEEFVAGFFKKDIKLKTEIEWQVKPGHMHLLTPLLLTEKNPAGLPLFSSKPNNKFLLAGKSDYLLNEESDSANNNVHLLRIVRDKNCKIFDHVRKIRTRILFNISPSDGATRKVINLHEILQQFAVKIDPISKLDKKLKALKISRQIRSKILKIFSNYNNGIQDIILFPFFLDFKIFIEELQGHINREHEKWVSRLDKDAEYRIEDASVSRFEDFLMELIKIFQESYNIRMLNCYQFEDINDFDLDFNSSIQQLLSVYSTIAIEIGNIFYPLEYQYGPIVQLNLKDTVSNYSSINYYIHHLTSPEFVFATLTKEILNFSRFEDNDLNQLTLKYQANLKGIKRNNPVLAEMINSNLLDFNYFLNDAIRFVISYNSNFNLFYFWFWTYNLQNASLYDKNGSLNEEHFRKELFRILFIQKFFDFDEIKEPVKCPLPELFTYWDRHYEKVKSAVNSYVKMLNEKGITQDFMQFLFKILDKSLTLSQGGCIIPNGNHEEVHKKVKKLKGAFSRAHISMQMFERFSKKEFAFANLKKDIEPTPSFNVPKNSLIYLQWYMLEYLNTVYELNDKNVSLLRRNWEDGKPLISFVLSNESKHLYSVDQTGGLFFDNMEQLNHYFRLSSMVLLDIWNYSLIRKKNFILKKLSIS